MSNLSHTATHRYFTDVDPMETFRMRAIEGSTRRAFYGKIKISSHVFGYLKLRDFKVLDVVDLETSPYVRSTNGFWLDVPSNAMQIMTVKSINPAEVRRMSQPFFQLIHFPRLSRHRSTHF